MYKYHYERVKTSRFIGAILEEHRSIIDRMANIGYKYVGFIPVRMTDYGKIKEADLIFEIKVD